MLTITFRRSVHCLKTVRQLVVGSIDSVAMGNRPSVGQKRPKSGPTTITPTITCGVRVEEESVLIVPGDSDTKGPDTTCTETKRQGHQRNDSAETSSTSSSVTEMPLVPPQRLSEEGIAFSALSLSKLEKCDIFYQLIERLVHLPPDKWMDVSS